MKKKIAFNIPNSKLLVLDMDDIIYFEKRERNIKICLTTYPNEIYLNNTMKSLSIFLKEEGFYNDVLFKSHCSYIVNVNHIKIINPRSITMSDQTEIPISNMKKEDFKKKIQKKISIIL